MRKWAMMVLWVLFLITTLAEASLAVELGIITGREKGTYYQFGLNLKELVKQHGYQLNVFPSNGSVENINAVFKRPGTQLGIVQSDVLAFVIRVQSNPVLKTIAKKVKMVFPLYNEEVHLVARKGIVDFDDLVDRKVAIGEEGSGTYLTAKLLFEVSDVAPRETFSIGTDEALARLKEGTIDAMFYVAGYPVKLFSENVSEQDGLDVIPISNKSIMEFYPKTEVPADTYKWKKEAVQTVAVKAVLIAYDFKTVYCQELGKFARIVVDNLNWLKENGHPKWKSVDFDYPLKGWQQYDCVKKYIGKAPQGPGKRAPQSNPVLDAIKDVL